MNPREVAVWLNNCTDEEFVETFALLDKAMDGRRIPTEYNKEAMINNMSTKVLCDNIKAILDEYKN